MSRFPFPWSVCVPVGAPCYTGADYETVDDGSAANEPVTVVDRAIDCLLEDSARLTAQAEQIGALMCRVQQLERENADLARRLVDAENVHGAPSLPANALKHGI